MNDRKLGTDCACGGSAGTDATGRMHYHCNGYKGPLDTYVCGCRCHTPDPYYQERKPADLGLQQAPEIKALVDAAIDSAKRLHWLYEGGYAYPGRIYVAGMDAPADTTLDDLTEAHTRLATGADPEKTRAALRRLADTGITTADIEHIPATLTRLFRQEPTMHVTDLNGTHLGKTITVHDDPQKITVNHDTDIIVESRASGPDARILGRQRHILTIGTFNGEVRGDSQVEVRP